MSTLRGLAQLANLQGALCVPTYNLTYAMLLFIIVVVVVIVLPYCGGAPFTVVSVVMLPSLV